MVDFLDDINIDGTVTAKRVKLTDSAGDEKDVATKEYVNNTVDAKFDEAVTSNGFATKEDLGMEREAREKDITDLNAVLTSKVDNTHFEEELRGVRDDQTNKDLELQSNIDVLRDYSNTTFATKQELESEISVERSRYESAIAYESDERSRVDSQIQVDLANTEANVNVLSTRVDELAATHSSEVSRIETSIGELSTKHDSDITSLRNDFEADLRNLNYIETLTVNGTPQTVANRIVDVDLTPYALQTDVNELNADVSALRTGKVDVPIDGSRFLTESEAQKLDNLASNPNATYATVDQLNTIPKFRKEVVQTLPATGDDDVLYLVPIANSSSHEEYIYVDGKWELLGTTDVELQNYYTKGDVYTKAEVDSLVDGLTGDGSGLVTKTQYESDLAPIKTVVNQAPFLKVGSQTTTSSDDGGANVYTFTDTSGNASSFVVRNGSKGSKGDTGATGATGPQGPAGSDATVTAGTALTKSGTTINHNNIGSAGTVGGDRAIPVITVDAQGHVSAKSTVAIPHIYISTNAPTANDGQTGDIWYQYE